MEDGAWDEDFVWLQDYAMFDRAPLVEYERHAGLAGLKAAVNDCSEEARFRVDTIGAAAQAGDGDIVVREARILKSMGESCGFLRLAELARVIEDVTRVRSARDTLPLVGELFRILELGLSELEAFADEIGAQVRSGGSRHR